MQKRLLFKVLSVASIAVGSISCGSVMYNQTSSMSGGDFSLTTIEVETPTYISESQFKVPISFGYTVLQSGAGPININGSNFRFKQGDGFSIGINPTYDFTKGRIQPYAKLRLGMNFFQDLPVPITSRELEYPSYMEDTYSTDNATGFYVAPQMGLRCFLTRDIAIVGGVGYQLSWLDYENIEQSLNFTGLAISFGLTYAF